MKRYVYRVAVFVVIMAVLVEIVALGTMAGGISLAEVEHELSRYVDRKDAEKIARCDLSVETNLLVSVSMKNLSSEALTVLLLHKSFPQWRRSELITKRREGFYLANACSSNQLTDEDVLAWVARRFEWESRLGQALKCESISEETKEVVRRRIQRTISHWVRRLQSVLFGEIE